MKKYLVTILLITCMFGTVVYAANTTNIHSVLNTAKVNSSQNTSGGSLTTGIIVLLSFNGADINWTSASAGTATDRSGQSNTGTLTNMNQVITPSVGMIGQSLLFDGINDRVTTPDVNLGIANNFTMAAWIKENAGINPMIYTRDNNVTRAWQFRVDTTGELRFIKFNAGGSNFQAVSVGKVNDNNWHFVAVTFDTTSGNILYIDGKQDGTQGDVTAMATGSGIGPIVGMQGGIQNFFNGSIDELRVYNRTFTAGEILSLYRLGRVLIK